MNPLDVKTKETYSIWLRATAGSESLPAQGIGILKPADTAENDGVYALVLGRNTIEFVPHLEPVTRQDVQDIDSNFRQGSICVAEIIAANEKVPNEQGKYRQIELQLSFFNTLPDPWGETPVCCSQKIVEDLKRKRITIDTDLLDRFTMKINGESYFIVQMWDMNKKKKNKTEDDTDDKRTEKEKWEIKEFTLHGRDARMKCRLEPMKDGRDEYLYAEKVAWQNLSDPAINLFLVRGTLKFSTIQERIAAIAKNTLELLNPGDNKYFALWKKYVETEKEVLMKKIQEIGFFRYTGIPDISERGFIFHLKKEISKEIIALINKNELVLTEEIPAYLTNTKMSWAEVEGEWEKINPPGGHQKPSGEVSECTHSSITLKFSKRISRPKILDPQLQYLSCSLSGSMKQISRREAAWNKLMTGTNNSPLISALLVMGDKLPNTGQKWGKMSPSSYFVDNKIFKYGPTDNQRKAINIAINTPDIALIQGPPGTGKTTVIAAIIERLNEEQDKTGAIKGKTLVSAFQQDAVKNITDKLSVNALPTLKFGRKRGEDDDDDKKYIDKQLGKWVTETTEKARMLAEKEAPPVSLAQAERENAFAKQLSVYACNPTKKNAKTLIKEMLDFNLPKSLQARAEGIQKRLSKSDVGYDEGLITAIRALRSNPGDFADDGPERAMNLYIYLTQGFDEFITDSDIALLKSAATWKSCDVPPFLEGLLDLKIYLLDKYKMRSSETDYEDEEIYDLFDDVRKHIFDGKTGDEKKQQILAEYLDELEFNPNGVKETIKEYSYAFAATTQQSVAKDISDARKNNTGIIEVFDTVIIDEAARATPPDLIIPLVEAKKRVILVGDHRQLPHMLDDKTVELLQLPEEQNELETSMFEHLFYSLQKLDEKDGNDEHHRTCTLNTQYRTHPILGDFASSQFYEKHNIKEKYYSNRQRPPSDFVHHLSGIEEKPAVWLNVHESDGYEDSGESNLSHKRTAEAELIAKKLETWIFEDAGDGRVSGKDLTFGVISFYSAQVEEIKKALKGKVNIDEINSDYKGKERIRIGTVDSFQGMEFDVAFLSMVRCPRNRSNLGENIDDKKFQQQVFGFLTKENRLCVSMTRQKKVLIVVGDADLVLTPLGGKAVPALGDFYKLCQKEGVVI